MRLKKILLNALCFAIATLCLSDYIISASYGSYYMGRHTGEFNSGSFDPAHKDRFRAKLQPCGSVTGSHHSGATITTKLKYFDHDVIKTGEDRVAVFKLQGRYVSKWMATKWFEAPKCHPDAYPLGAEVHFDAYCQNCDAHLDVTEYYIED